MELLLGFRSMEHGLKSKIMIVNDHDSDKVTSLSAIEYTRQNT